MRPGSRLLLGAALAAGCLGGMYSGARLADFLMDLLGVVSGTVRLAGKVLAMAVALPVSFYLVERAFLSRSSPRAAEEEREGG